MQSKEFVDIRRRLKKSQRQMAQLLGTSVKAVQSFEQGWRGIPVYIERQMLFLLAKKDSGRSNRPCWEIQDCPPDVKLRCPAWEFQSGDLCWFINGTICHGKVQKNWAEKMKICRSCKVFRSHLKL